MEPSLSSRLEALLTRAFDGEATAEERAELALLAEADPRLAAWAELRDTLRAALVAPGPADPFLVDVVGDVMAALEADAAWSPLGLSLAEAVRGPSAEAPPIDIADAVLMQLADEAAWAPVGGALREAVRAPDLDIADLVMAEIAGDAAWAPLGAAVRDAVQAAPAVDIAELVMAGIDPEAELSAYFDGELAPERNAVVAARLLREPSARAQLAAFAAIGQDLRDVTQRGEDVWPAVADGIGVERDALHGWDAIAGPLKEAFAALPDIDVAGAVMASVEPAVVRMPRWASLGGPLLGFAMAAALLFAVLPMSPSPSSPPVETADRGAPVVTPDLRLATVNDAQVEEITAPGDVVVQVMQFEDGGPTFILVDDPPSGSGVPL